MTRPGLAGLGGRFAVMLGGEVLQSVFHLGLNLGLVRVLSAHDYGTFAMIFALGSIALTVVRAVAGVPAATFIPQARSARAVRALAVTFGSGAAGLSLALAGLVTAALAPIVGTGAVPAGAFVGLWSLRSYLRSLVFARGRPGVAGASDLVFTLSGAGFLALLLRGDGSDLLWQSLALLAAAHALGAATALALLREPVRIDLRRPQRRYRRLWRSLAWSVAGVAIANVQAQGQILLIGLLAGPAAYAPIAATLVLFSPLRLLGTVVVNLIQPEMAARIADSARGPLRTVLTASTLVLTAACLVYGAALVGLFGFIEDHVFDHHFADETLGPIALTVWITVTLTMLYAAPKTLLETRRAFRELAWIAAWSAGLGMALVAALVAFVSPAWSMAGVAVSEVVILVWCWRATLRPRTGSAPEPLPRPRPLHAPPSGPARETLV